MSPRSGATAGTATQPEAPFRFTDPPGELRNNIYRHYFSELLDLKRRNWSVWPEAGGEFLSILQSSRQIRREAAPIFYQEHIGNAGHEDEQPWIFESRSILGMLKTLLVTSQRLKEYSPDTVVLVACDPKVGSDMSVIVCAVRKLSGTPDFTDSSPDSDRFSVRQWYQSCAISESLELWGPLGQVDWSSLMGLYNPSMEGPGKVDSK